MKARRWGDNDRYWGPLTFAPHSGSWRPTGIILGSGRGEDDDWGGGAFLRVMLFGWTLIVALPSWLLRPDRIWHEITIEPTRSRLIAQGRRPGYWELLRREYGFSASEGHLSVLFGRQTDGSGERRWGWFYPWREWRHVRHTLYRPDHRFFADMPQGRFLDTYDERADLEKRCPTVTFAFLDFDGEPITAKCRIEERAWRRGVGWFRWLGLFSKRVERSLMLEFSRETGSRKGSWKGGTLGHAIDMRRVGDEYESPADAFQRYCDQNGMTFVREPHLYERYGLTEKPEGWNLSVLGWFHRGMELRDSDAFREAFRERAQTVDDPLPSPKPKE